MNYLSKKPINFKLIYAINKCISLSISVQKCHAISKSFVYRRSPCTKALFSTCCSILVMAPGFAVSGWRVDVLHYARLAEILARCQAQWWNTKRFTLNFHNMRLSLPLFYTMGRHIWFRICEWTKYTIHEKYILCIVHRTTVIQIYSVYLPQHYT